jgi:hypothetical protein
MKKFLISILALASTGGAYAQQVQDEVVTEAVAAEETVAEAAPAPEKKPYTPDYTPPNGYINLAWATQKIQYPGEDATKTNEGFSLEFGNTFFFNGRRPVHTAAGDIRFGLDWSYLDLTYATYDKLQDNPDLKVEKSHFANIGMQIGPSVTYTPIRKLNIKLYGHYAPSYAAFTLNGFDAVTHGYAGYVTGGLQVSYMFLTLGVEMRSATAQLATINEDSFNINPNIDPENLPDPGNLPDINDLEDSLTLKFNKGSKSKVKLPGTRFTLGFRF